VSETEHENQSTDGFEYRGEFYRFHVSDMGKDLMLIDRIAGMSVLDFFDIIDDDHERGRGPVLLTLIATSIRHKRPDWSVERIVRMVMELSLRDVTFLGGDSEEAVLPPPPEQTRAPSDEPSRSTSNGSSPSSTPPASTTSEPSFAGPI
jgi:hypothetical protein